MATQIPRPLTMNRRQLLTTVAAIPTSGILPPQLTADAVPVPSVPTSEPSPLNVCPATARRIEEIIARNRIRAEACLPLLSISKELRRMKEADDAAAFEAFANSHRGAVWAELLAKCGKQEASRIGTRRVGWKELRFSQRSAEFFDNASTSLATLEIGSGRLSRRATCRKQAPAT
jgi:hypothetical protein